MKRNRFAFRAYRNHDRIRIMRIRIRRIGLNHHCRSHASLFRSPARRPIYDPDLPPADLFTHPLVPPPVGHRGQTPRSPRADPRRQG
jgi:hypothetical protein